MRWEWELNVFFLVSIRSFLSSPYRKNRELRGSTRTHSSKESRVGTLNLRVKIEGFPEVMKKGRDLTVDWTWGVRTE